MGNDQAPSVGARQVVACRAAPLLLSVCLLWSMGTKMLFLGVMRVVVDAVVDFLLVLVVLVVVIWSIIIKH